MDKSSKLYQQFRGCTSRQTLVVLPLLTMTLARNSQSIVSRCFLFRFDFILSQSILMRCWPLFFFHRYIYKPGFQERLSNLGVHAIRCFLGDSYVVVGLAQVVRSPRLVFQDRNIRFEPLYIYTCGYNTCRRRLRKLPGLGSRRIIRYFRATGLPN
jgi:hypothetical protein